MNITGEIKAAKREYQLGEPISLTLSINNVGSDTVFLLVPRGRSGGIRTKVIQGLEFEIKDLSFDAEPGLQPENKIKPAETLKLEIPLNDWMTVKEPGTYVIECTIPVEIANVSLGGDAEKRISKNVTIQSNVCIIVTANASKNE